MNVTINVNGEDRVLDVTGHESLLSVLRNDLDSTLPDDLHLLFGDRPHERLPGQFRKSGRVASPRSVVAERLQEADSCSSLRTSPQFLPGG